MPTNTPPERVPTRPLPPAPEALLRARGPRAEAALLECYRILLRAERRLRAEGVFPAEGAEDRGAIQGSALPPRPPEGSDA